MDAQGYTFEKVIEGLYEVLKPGQAKPYFVQIDPLMVEFMGGEFCTCAFAKNNEQFGHCKHRTWILRQIAEDERLEAEALAYEDYLNEIAAREEEAAWVDFAAACDEVAAGLPEDLQTATWPRCSECNSIFDEAVCGLPLDLCDRCEKRALI